MLALLLISASEKTECLRLEGGKWAAISVSANFICAFKENLPCSIGLVKSLFGFFHKAIENPEQTL